MKSDLYQCMKGSQVKLLKINSVTFEILYTIFMDTAHKKSEIFHSGILEIGLFDNFWWKYKIWSVFF